nr:MAG TPA: tail protein [Caudoviricetes sp.]
MSLLIKRGGKTVLDTDSLGVSAILVELPAANPDVDLTNLPQSYGSIVTYAGINPGVFEFDITIRENSVEKALAKAELISGVLHPSNGLQDLYMDALSPAGGPLDEGWVHSVILNRSVEWKRDKELWPAIPGGDGVAQLTARVEFTSPDPHGYKTSTGFSDFSGYGSNIPITPRGNAPALVELRFSPDKSYEFTRSSPLNIQVNTPLEYFYVTLAGFAMVPGVTTVLNFKDMEFYQERTMFGGGVRRTQNLADRFLSFKPINLPAGKKSTIAVYSSVGNSFPCNATFYERRI